MTGAAGGLALTDVTVTGTVPSLSSGGGSFASSFTTSSFTVDGVDTRAAGLGPFSSATLTSGRILAAADAHADDAVVDAGYAAQNKLTTGNKVDVGRDEFHRGRAVRVPAGGSPTDVYIPLARAQAIGRPGHRQAGRQGEHALLSRQPAPPTSRPCRTRSLRRCPARPSPIRTIWPTGDRVADQHRQPGQRSGTWLSVVVLVAAFTVASLLTMAAVARRVREFGTLKALGWRSSRIVGQVMGESITIGIFGGAAGIGLGYAGAALIDQLAPKLSATIGRHASPPPLAGGPGRLQSRGGRRRWATPPHGLGAADRACDRERHPARRGLAVAGGLVAGSFGGWRAARLRPAAALARVE